MPAKKHFQFLVASYFNYLPGLSLFTPVDFIEPDSVGRRVVTTGRGYPHRSPDWDTQCTMSYPFLWRSLHHPASQMQCRPRVRDACSRPNFSITEFRLQSSKLLVGKDWWCWFFMGYGIVPSEAELCLLACLRETGPLSEHDMRQWHLGHLFCPKAQCYMGTYCHHHCALHFIPWRSMKFHTLHTYCLQVLQ